MKIIVISGTYVGPLTPHDGASNCPAATVVVSSALSSACLTFSTVTLANELRAQSLLVPATGNTPGTQHQVAHCDGQKYLILSWAMCDY